MTLPPFSKYLFWDTDLSDLDMEKHKAFTVEKFTLVLLRRLMQEPILKDLRLVGGTALDLQLGHRNSIDLDFFGTFDATADQIEKELITHNFDVETKYNTKSIKTFLIDGVKVDMVNYRYGWIDEAVEDEGVKMGSLKDIAAIKKWKKVKTTIQSNVYEVLNND